MVYRHSAFSNRRTVVNARISEIDVVGVGSQEKYTQSLFKTPCTRAVCTREKQYARAAADGFRERISLIILWCMRWCLNLRSCTDYPVCSIII
jgi:hypothetical protein